MFKMFNFSTYKDGKKEGFLNLFQKFNEPFHTLHIDHVGPFDPSNKGHKYLLVMVDGFTKFCRLYPTKTTNTIEAINHLKSYFRQYSKPLRIVSDRGTCFTSKKFKEFLGNNEISHVLNATNSPQSNGQVERVNRIIVPMIVKLASDDKKNGLPH